jgi:dolichyl-diphosphooligosaccharide---protein glycosyltransferase
LIANTSLFSVGQFNFKLSHLLILGILAISFSTSFMIRSQAADYGLELNEFDPFFNYRATKFIVENGIGDYVSWHDNLSWYPMGRDVSLTSQEMLHITAAILYQIFGGGSSLYEFTIWFPVVFGSMTAIVVFALTRVIAGTTAGLFASLFYAVSVPIIVRGTIGWFKSEPLGLFYGLLGLYLFLSALYSKNNKISFLKFIGGGIFIGFGLASWGGINYIVFPLSIFFISLPFFRKDSKFLIWSIPVFITALLLTTLIFERPGTTFIFGHGGFLLIGTTAFLISSIIIMKKSGQNRIRNGILFLVGVIGSGISLMLVNNVYPFLHSASFRYFNAINPFLTTTDPLVDSVAEHATTTLQQSFFFFSILMLFAGLGIWLIFRNKEKLQEYSLKIKSEMIVFALIIGLVGIYVSSTFVRLELFGSISIIILSSIGLSIIISEIFKTKKIESKKPTKQTKSITKIIFASIIIAFLTIPIILPVEGSWIHSVKAPPTILNGGSQFNIATNDWPDAMNWLKNNTPQDAVIASWWDYGYWISTLAERTTLADNATIHTIQIQKIAKMLLSSPDSAWEQLNKFGADYVLIYVTARSLPAEQQVYILMGGADESKKQWFMRIAEEPLAKHLHQDGMSGTKHFWENTLLGKMIPYSPIAYVNFQNNLQYESYQPGTTEIHVKDIKYPIDGNGPLRLVYSSPSFENSPGGIVSAVLIYEVNKEYQPSEKSIEPIETTKNEVAIIETKYGDITIKFRSDVAPYTVENFKKLASSGFYDGTIFHRIIPGFMIQGGDPNTKTGTRDTWGQGNPGYSIEPEFSNLKHKKYAVSMARGPSIDSAGSQFFIMTGDAPWLDGQYTIFGEVVSGQNVVDQIERLETNEKDQPDDPLDAIIEKITIIS